MSATVRSLHEEICYLRSVASAVCPPVMSAHLPKTVERAGREVDDPSLGGAFSELSE